MEPKQDVLPKWLEECIAKYRLILGIGDEIDLAVTLADVVDGDERTLGSNRINFRYWSSHITLRRDIQNDRAGRLLVAHEMYHVPQMDAFQAKARIIELLPKEMQDHAEELWHDGNEHLTERLSHALVNYEEMLEKAGYTWEPTTLQWQPQSAPAISQEGEETAK